MKKIVCAALSIASATHHITHASESKQSSTYKSPSSTSSKITKLLGPFLESPERAQTKALIKMWYHKDLEGFSILHIANQEKKNVTIKLKPYCCCWSYKAYFDFKKQTVTTQTINAGTICNSYAEIKALLISIYNQKRVVTTYQPTEHLSIGNLLHDIDTENSKPSHNFVSQQSSPEQSQSSANNEPQKRNSGSDSLASIIVDTPEYGTPESLSPNIRRDSTEFALYGENA